MTVDGAEDAGGDADRADDADDRPRRTDSERKRGPFAACGRGWRDVTSTGADSLRSLRRLSLLRDRERAGGLRRGEQQLVGRGGEDAVAALELRPVHGEVRLVDQLVLVAPVDREGRDADRDGGADRVARGRDLEELLGDGAPYPLGDLERLLDGRLGEQDRELLAAEAGRDVEVAQLAAEDVRHAADDRVAGEVAERVVDLPEQVEVDHEERERSLVPARARELVPEDGGEVTGVEEPCLRLDARLGLELRHRERAVDQDERRDREHDEPGVAVPERGNRDADRDERQVRREAVDREEREVAQRVAVREAHHRPEQQVVRQHEDERDDRIADAFAQVRVRVERANVEHRLPGPERGEARERVVRDVERLDVPGVALLQPLRDMLDQRDEHEELRGQDQHRRNEEHHGGVVALVARRPDHEELGERRCAGEEGECGPRTVGVVVESTEIQRRDRRRGQDDQEEVGACRPREGALGRLELAVERHGRGSGISARSDGVRGVQIWIRGSHSTAREHATRVGGGTSTWAPS